MMTKKRKANTISITELFRMFPTEQSCIDWLEKARWNGKPVCPHCGGDENVTKPASKPNTYWHKDCRMYFTVKTGTVMHSSKTDTRNWMIAIYYYMTGRKGISAMQLSKELGVQYRTAWHLGHRIREACKEGGGLRIVKDRGNGCYLHRRQRGQQAHVQEIESMPRNRRQAARPGNAGTRWQSESRSSPDRKSECYPKCYRPDR